MGGNAKQSQRTKNNVRPSSSGRSAELLNNVITTDNVFGGLNTDKGLPGLFPTMAPGGLNRLMSNEFSLAFKKLNKKDPITRTKALNELLLLITSRKKDDILAVLPTWAHFYLMLTIDNDRKVRELTQACHGAIVTRCGRKAGPHIRQLLPAWLLAYHDDHAPAQALAASHLIAIFPNRRLSDAITYCKTEIMALITDNLTGNAEAITNKKCKHPDEKKCQVSRIIASSLRAMEMFTRLLGVGLDEWLRESLEPLLNGGYWKLATHESDQIRAAWYVSARGAVARLGKRLGDARAQVCDELLAAEVSAAVAAPRWAAVLAVLRHLEDWHVWMKRKELLIQRLIDTIEIGGGGEASVVRDVALPLLRALPPDMLDRDFYLNLFNAFFTGLRLKPILNSRSERQAWLATLADCLRHLATWDSAFVVEIVALTHRNWLETMFTIPDDNTSRHLIQVSGGEMAALGKHWIKQTRDAPGDISDKLVRNFWQNLGVSLVTRIESLPKDDRDASRLIDSHTLFLKSLKANNEGKKSIRFVDELPLRPVAPEGEEFDHSVLESYEHSLRELVGKTCSSYFEYVEKKQMSSSIFPSLLTLVVAFDSEELFASIARGYNTSCAHALYDAALRGWLAADATRCPALAHIIFIMSKYFTDAELDSMYDSFRHLSPVALEWCISLTFSHPYCKRAVGARWLLGEVVERTLVALSERGDRAAERLVLAWLSSGDGEHVSPRAVEAVASGLARALNAGTETLEGAEPGRGLQGHEKVVEIALGRAQFASAVCLALGSSRHADQLLVALFKLNLKLVPRDLPSDDDTDDEGAADAAVARFHDELDEVQWEELRRSWHEPLRVRPRAAREGPQAAAARALAEARRLRLEVLDVFYIQHMVSLAVHLVDFEEPDIGEVIQVTERIFSEDVPQSAGAARTYALRKDIVHGRLNCPLDDGDAHMRAVLRAADGNEVGDLTDESVAAFANNLLFRAFYLKDMTLKCEEDVCLLSAEFFRALYADVLHDAAVLASLCEGYAFMPFYKVLLQTKTHLDDTIEALIISTPEEINIQMINILTQKSLKLGYYWAFTRVMFVAKVPVSVPDKSDDRNDDEGKPQEDSHETAAAEAGGDVTTAGPDIDTLMLDKIVARNGFFHDLQAQGSGAPGRAAYVAAVRSWYWRLTGGGGASRARAAELGARAAAALPALRLDPLLDDYYKHDEHVFNDRNYSKDPWDLVVCHSSLLELLNTLVQTKAWDLTAHEWDFINIVLCSVLNSIATNCRVGCTKWSAVARPVLLLARAAVLFARGVPAGSERRQPSDHVAALPNEWRDIFAPEAFSHVLAITKVVLASALKPPLRVTTCHIAVVQSLIEAVEIVNWDQLPGPKKQKEYSLDSLCNSAFGVMRADAHYAYKYLASQVLNMIAKPMVLEDVDKMAQWNELRESGDDGEEDISLSLARYYGEIRETYAQLRDVWEGDRRLDDSPIVMSRAFGVILTALGMLRQHGLARGDLVHLYINSLGEAGVVSPILTASMRLLPATLYRWEPAPAALALFTADPVLRCEEPPRALLSAAACRVTLCCMQRGGPAARAHWSALHPRDATRLQRVVQVAVAPPLLQEQLAHLREHAHLIEEAEVQVTRDAGGEATVVCLAVIDERNVELSVQLSGAHPLVPPRTIAPVAPLAAHAHAPRLYLAYQSGWVCEALRMWTALLRRRVQAAPQCYICYCRLHASAAQLPHVPCHTCGNRFHSYCLRKWFQTSKKSNCPLCRTVF